MSAKIFDFNSAQSEVPIQNQTGRKIWNERKNSEGGAVIASQNKQNLKLHSNQHFQQLRRLRSAITHPRVQHQPLPLRCFSLQGMAKMAAILVLSIAIAVVALIPANSSIWAEDGQGGNERASGSANGGARGVAKSLGWVAIGAGLIANIPFIAYARIRKVSVVSLGGGHEITRGLAIRHPTMLNLHMGINAVGFVAGIAHGVLLIRGLDAISLALAITMTVLVASGIVLRFARMKSGNSSTRNYARIFHTQLILSGLLVLLVILHLFSVGVFE